MNNIALIGLGPHSKRIHINYFKRHNIMPTVVVDLLSNKEYTQNFMSENEFYDTNFWFLPDEYKDELTLPQQQYDELKDLFTVLNISHIIISTEPKAHNMYLKFALENNINVLCDKPITVVKGMNKLENVQLVQKQFSDLLALYEKSNCDCKIMCQREYHRGYDYIKNILKNVVNKYNVPITYIDIYHCDGNWEMLHDLDKENHPYKYGYGKLFHSGYHFISLLAELLKINGCVTKNKQIKNGKVYNQYFTPEDELSIFTPSDYRKIFKNENIPSIYYKNAHNLKNYGEKNYYGLLSFYNNSNKLTTTANLNILHYGFSRRGWLKSRDYYKQNGRIRHERINIQVGTLLNVQIHSYQSKEIKDRTDLNVEIKTGGLEHFDIDIYRNVDIIGGKTFERIKLKDLYSDISEDHFIGYNEYSREDFLTDFLERKTTKSDLSQHKLAMNIFYSISKGLEKHYKKEDSIEHIEIPDYI